MSSKRGTKRSRKTLFPLKAALSIEEEKNQLAQEVIKDQNKTIAALKRIVETDKLDISPQQMVMYADLMQQKAHSDVDIGYIRTLLFPELYNHDIPQPLSCTSFCRFSEKKEYTISSGTKGTGMILWYPKVNNGPVMFVKDGADSAALSSWSPSYPFNASSYFTSTCLVSASISVQYVGQLQTEQGYFVGSSLYGVNAANVSSDEIENGQFRVIAKPGEGIRLVYMPKDSRDFNYYPVDTAQTNGTATVNASSGNAGAAALGTSIDLQLTTSTTFFDTNTKLTSGLTLSYNKTADCIAIYWKGMKANDLDVLRVDTMRRFNAFPKSEMRDFLDVSKPKRSFDQRKTVDVITDMQFSVPQLAGHSIKQMDRVSDQIQAYLPNIGHLYNVGALKEGQSLSGFASKLALEATGNVGFNTYSGRIWEND